MYFRDYNLGTTANRNYYRKLHEPIFFIPGPYYPGEYFLVASPDKVPGIFDNRYFVSNYGRVYDRLKERYIPISYSRLYYHVSLATIDENDQIHTKTYWLHRLVMQVFCYRPDFEFLEVNHLNGDHADNRVCNLEWCTKEENMQYALEHRQHPHSENAARSVLTNAQAEQVCKMLESGMKMVDIARETGINYDRIKDIKRGIGYRYISENYNIPPTMDRRGHLSDEEVISIAKRLGNGEYVKDIAKDLGLGATVVQDIKSRSTYSHLTKDIYMGEVKPVTKLLNEHVVRICELLQDGYDTTNIIQIMKQEFGIDVQDYKIWRIRRRVQNTDISANYIW